MSTGCVRPVVGIVGGLGPLATADIYAKAMRQVRADRGDSDYPDIIVNTASAQEGRGNVPDGAHRYDMAQRSLYIYRVAAELKRQRASRVLVPDFLTQPAIGTISRAVEVPIIDIVAVLVGRIRADWPSARRIGLLTTTTAIRQGIFASACAAAGLEPVYPDDAEQEKLVMEAIYGADGLKHGVTAGHPAALIREACRHLLGKGAEIIATGVTELPLIDRAAYPADRYLDCNEAIGRALLLPDDEVPLIKDRRGVIGILGGLGPAATVDIFSKIVRRTPANRDQDHLRIVIENCPQIPDRSGALVGRNEDPSVAMLISAERLKTAGADFIIVPCNTAHVFLRWVQQQVRLPVISMIEETVRHITGSHPEARRVGLLATTGTVGAKVYEDALTQAGLATILPGAEAQRLVMEAIYGPAGIKAGSTSGQPREQLLAAAHELVAAGAQVVILGCTEIPLVLHDGDAGVPFIDPTEILAASAVAHALQPRAYPGS